MAGQVGDNVTHAQIVSTCSLFQITSHLSDSILSSYLASDQAGDDVIPAQYITCNCAENGYQHRCGLLTDAQPIY